MKENNIIEVKNLTKKFGNFTAVNRISFNVKKGEVFAILGPNGAGKTTTVRILATLLNPDGGEARVAGYDVANQQKYVRAKIGLTGQYATVDEELTAQENLEIFCQLNGLNSSQTKRRIEELLREFSLEHTRNRTLKNFSGGMRRRLDLAISLIDFPEVIFLDEPTTGLDPRTRSEMWQTIRRLVDSGSTVVLTTQYLEEADQLADRIIIIDHGEIIAEGTASELKQSIGKATLQISLINEADLSEGKKILSNNLKKEIETIRDENLLLAPMQDPSLLVGILQEFKDENIMIDQLAIRQPSLDEVFLTLTKYERENECNATDDTKSKEK